MKIAVPVTGAEAVTPNSYNTLSVCGVSTLFINGKPAAINDLKNLRNPSSWLVMFLVVTFNKIRYFSKGLTTFIFLYIVVYFIF